MAKRGLADTANVLGGFFIALALTVYVMAEVFKNIKGLPANSTANLTVTAIKTGGYAALGMAVIIGVVLIANIIMGVMKSGGQ